MNFNRILVLGTLIATNAFTQSQTDFEAWEGFSDPDIMSSGFTHVVSELPSEGTIIDGSKAWSGHYWPSKKGGINNRWNSASLKDKFENKSPSKEAVFSMNEAELSELAPSEKFDLFLGRYDYPLKTEAKGSTSRLAPDWAGICHGWAPASILHNEPTPKTVTNKDGLKIPFGSADIKALLSYYYAFHFESVTSSQMGLRCFFGSWMGGARGCSNDLNAGAFHIVIANKLGLQKEGFLMDADRFREVWNQPVVGFKTVILNANLPKSKKAAKNAVREIRVATELFYTDESEPRWNVVHGTVDQIISKKDLVYRLEISADGKIVGGEWESEERPDFLWNKEKSTSFEGLFARLPELLND